MKLVSFILTISVKCCLGIVLSPLENNDNLKHITKQFVAEWQWESWPIKKEVKTAENQTPGPRINAALYKEPSKMAWYLFGGLPVDSAVAKVYSDIWKYSVETRTWEKFVPHSSPIKNQGGKKTGGVMSFPSDFLNEITESVKQSRNFKIFLCGEMGKINTTKLKNSDLWSTFYKRKKPKREKKEKLESLVVYMPRTSKPSTVWQINVQNNLWKSYVCCCEAADKSKGNFTSKSFTSVAHKILPENGKFRKTFDFGKNITEAKNYSLIFETKINKIEDELDNAQQHLSIKNLNKKRKINQNKKAESLRMYVKFQRKRHADKMEKELNKTKLEKVLGKEVEDFVNKENHTKAINENKKEGVSTELHEEQINQKNKEGVMFNSQNIKTMTKYCPENLKNYEFVTWCDGKNEALITSDISSTQIFLWVFNLRATQWTRMKVKFSDRDKWSLCSDINTVRYAEAGEEAYLVCTPKNKPNDPSTSSNNSTDSFGLSRKNNFVRKLVFRMNYKNQILDSLGEIQLNSYFGTPEGEADWRNTSKVILQAVKNSNNETVLFLAYLNAVDLWVLTPGLKTKEYFDLTEKIWRGSALKWFDKYNAAFYNFQFVSESGEVETVLIQNPRIISVGEYWKTERGRFIIRIFKNENLKNQSFENRTREQNLTFELLQSDDKSSEVASQFSSTYSYFIFFGIIFAVIKVFILIILVKKISEKSRKSKIRGECRKSPLIIRYSVIPDDMLQPVT